MVKLFNGHHYPKSTATIKFHPYTYICARSTECRSDNKGWVDTTKPVQIVNNDWCTATVCIGIGIGIHVAEARLLAAAGAGQQVARS